LLLKKELVEGELPVVNQFAVDSKIKLLASLILAITITALHTLKLLIAAFILGLGLLFFVKVERQQLWARFIPLLPFILPILLLLPLLVPGQAVFRMGILAYSLEGLLRGITITLRILSIVFIFTALAASTGRQALLIGARELGIPQIFIQITEFAFRYLEVIYYEARAMLMARKCRGYEQRKIFNIAEIKQLGILIGMLFYRSYARAERIYTAMLARGYSSDLRVNTTTGLKKSDFLLSLGTLLLCMFLLFADRGGLTYWM